MKHEHGLALSRFLVLIEPLLDHMHTQHAPYLGTNSSVTLFSFVSYTFMMETCAVSFRHSHYTSIPVIIHSNLNTFTVTLVKV